jgi:hypothetical protein
MATEHIRKLGYDVGNEFEFGTALIIDALARSLSDNGSGTPLLTKAPGDPHAGVPRCIA